MATPPSESKSRAGFLGALEAHNSAYTGWSAEAMLGIGLALMSAATNRNLVIRSAISDIFPSVRVVRVAPAYFGEKSSSMGFASKLLNQAMPGYILPADTSLAGLEEELMERGFGRPRKGKSTPGQGQRTLDPSKLLDIAALGSKGFWLIDECAGVLSDRRDYNTGFDQFLNLLYDCPDEPPPTRRASRNGKRVLRQLRRVFVPSYWGTQPSEVPYIFTPRRIASGWARRCLVSWSDEVKVKELPHERTKDQDLSEAALARSLALVAATLEKNPCSLDLSEVLVPYNSWRKDFLELVKELPTQAEQAALAGLADYALRIAALKEVASTDVLAAQAADGRIRLTIASMNWAIETAIPVFRAGMERVLLRVLAPSGHDLPQDAQGERGAFLMPGERFLNLLRESAPNDVSQSEVLRTLRLSAAELQAVVESPGVRENICTRIERTKGRPARRYGLR